MVIALVLPHLFVCIYIHILRLVPIILLKLPIMLWSNAPEFCLTCSNYVPYVNHFMLHKFNIIFLLNHKYQLSL